jgi:hypothetical protein
MAAGDRAPPVLARRAHEADLIRITGGGARRMRAGGGIPVVAAEGKNEEERVPRGVPIPFQPRPRWM